MLEKMYACVGYVGIESVRFCASVGVGAFL